MTKNNQIPLETKELEELKELDKKHFIHPTSNMKELQKNGPPFIFTKGEGIYLEDGKGKKVIDGLSSLWNVNIGHGRKELAEVAYNQMTQLAYTSTFNNWSNEPAIRLATEIAEWTPGNLNSTFFTSGGSEANDTAFKTVRHYWKIKGHPKKTKIISRKLSYHGLAMGATSATGIKPFNTFTSSIAPDFQYVESSIEAFQKVIEEEGAENIAAFISEPIQGSGGVNIPSNEYFQGIRKICDDNNILFISDEVICGFGRTGKKFGIDHFNVVPDIITMAKGVTSGYAPLGGMIVSDDIYKDLIEFTESNFWHGYTYSGHPTVTAVGLKNLQIIKQEDLIRNVNLMGKKMKEGFEWIQQQHQNFIIEYRSIGLLGAIELKKDNNSTELIGSKVAKEALERGLFCRSISYDGQDSLAFAPPFSITSKQLEEMITIVDDSMKAIKNK